MRWYEQYTGEPKTHNRARQCQTCKSRGYKCGCQLPFRKTRPIRKIAKMDNKPMLFTSLWFARFTGKIK